MRCEEWGGEKTEEVIASKGVKGRQRNGGRGQKMERETNDSVNPKQID